MDITTRTEEVIRQLVTDLTGWGKDEETPAWVEDRIDAAVEAIETNGGGR